MTIHQHMSSEKACKSKYIRLGFIFTIFLLTLSQFLFAQSGATVTASGSTLLCNGNTVQLTVQNAPAGSDFQWMRNNTIIPGEVSSSFSVILPGTYTSIVTFNNEKDTLNTIQISKAVDATLNGSGATLIDGKPYFKICASSASNFTFTNASSTIASISRYVIKWGDGTPNYESTTFSGAVTHLFPVGTRKMTFITYAGTCVDSTMYTVFVGNIPAGGLVGVGGSTICSENEQKFVIAGTKNNPPGTMYIMFYNDGSKRDTFYHPAPDTVSHIFKKSSCGTTSSNGTQSFPNSYGAFLSIVNPCGSAGGSILPIYVSDKPKAEFSVSPSDTSCVNQVLTITNTTKLMNNVENGTCKTMKYVWRITSLTPGGAWTLTSGSLGNDFGSGDPNVWTAGTLSIKPRFTVVGTYAVKLLMINSTLCGADSIEKIICINPLPTADFTTDVVTGCAPLTVNAAGVTNTVLCGQNQFNWSVTYTATSGCKPDTSSITYTNGTNSRSANPQIRFNTPGTYRLRLLVRTPGSGCASQIKEIQIVVKSKPVVSLTAPAQICLSEKIRPAVNATCYATNATYQWTFIGANNETFSGRVPDSVGYTTAGTYTIKVGATNECGTTDSTRQLVVKPLPVMTQPLNVAFCGGQPLNVASFTSSLSNTVFNWTNNQPAIGLLSSGTGNINSFTATNSTSSPIIATIRVTPSLNGCSGEQKTYTITVNPAPAAPVTSNVVYCQFDVAAPLTALATSGHDLRWYSLENGGVFSSVAPTPSTTSEGIKIFYVSQFNTATGCESQRSAIEVRVNSKPIVQNIMREVCAQEAFEIAPVSSLAGTVYTWSAPVLAAGLTGGIAGASQTTIKGQLDNNFNIDQTATYTVTPSIGNCVGAAFNVTVVVKPSAKINNKDFSICSGTPFSFTPTHGQINDRIPANTTYSWSAPVVTPAGMVTGTSTGSTVNLLNQTLANASSNPSTVRYSMAPVSGTCKGDSFLVVLTVMPKANIAKQTVTICSRSMFDATPTNGNGNIVPANTLYTWELPVVTPAGSVTGATAQTTAVDKIGQTLINTTLQTVMVVYKVKPVSGTQVFCEGDVFEVVVYVNPQSGVTDQTASICSDNIFSVLPAGVAVGTTYSWLNPVSNPVGSITGGSAQSIPQLAISQSLKNTTNQVATLTYDVEPKTGTCADSRFKVVVKVFPKPQIQDLNLEVCTGNELKITPTHNGTTQIIPSNTKYSWGTPVVTPAGAVSGFSGQAIPQESFNQILTNNTFTPATLTYTVIAVSGEEGNCNSNTFKVTVTVNPDAKAIMNVNSNVGCAPFQLSSANVFNASAEVDGTQFQWFVNNQPIGSTKNFPGYIIQDADDSVIVKLNVINGKGCKNDMQEQLFYTRPVPQSTFATSVDTVCGPAMISLNNLSPNSSLLSYRWDFGNGQISSAYQPSAIKFMPAASYGDTTYTIKLSVYNACDTAEYTQKVVVRSAPGTSFTANRVVGCSPVEILFTNTSAGLNNTYEWNFGDGTASVTHTVKDTISHWYYTGAVSTFPARLIARNFCGADTVIIPVQIRPNSIKMDVKADGNLTKGCAPLTVKFVNHSSGSNSYKWDFGDGNVIIRSNGKDTVYHTYVALGKFDVKVFSSNGCSDTSAYVTAVQTYTAPVAGFSSDKNTVCRGENIQFANASQGANTYTWIFGNGVRSALPNPAYAYTSGGAFDVKLVASIQHAPGVVCHDTATQRVIIKDSLMTTFALSSDRGTCTPFVVNFQQPVASVSSVSWDFGDGNISTEFNPSHTYFNNGAYQARLVVKSTSGCTYTAAKSITVIAPEGTAKVKSGYYCADVPVQFTAAAFNTDSIEWNFGDGSKQVTGNTGMVYHRFTKPGIFIPSVYLRNVSGCVYEIKLKDTVRIENIEAGFKTIVQKSCGYTDVQFVDTSRSLYGANQIQWIFGDGTTGAGASVTHRYMINGNYPVRMMVNGKVGCNDTTAQTLTIDINQKPDVQISGKNTACTDLASEFKASFPSSNDITFYKWQISNGYTAGTDKLNYKFVNTGVYKITLIAGSNQQCFDTATLDLQVLQSPKVQTSNDATICREKSIGLQATGAITYAWYPVEGLSCTNCPNPIARPYTSTQYVAKGTAANGCYHFDTVSVSVKQPFKISASKSDSLCLGKSMQLTVSGANSYTWSPAVGLSNPLSATPVASPSISTTYRVIGSDNQCFTDTAYVRIGVGKIPSIELGSDQNLNTGAPFKIKPAVTNGPIKSWSWTPATDLSCVDCAEPVAAPGNNITYTATAVTTYGCIAKDTISFKVFCENSQVFVPNAFTPDGDGINDILMVRARGVSKVRYFRIFNRWGEMVFERYNFQPNDQANAWDGKYKGQESGPAVYVYMLEVECSNGTPFTYKGNITLVK